MTDRHFLNVYCGQIEDQCEAALASLSQIDELSAAPVDVRGLFWNLDHFINRAAMVSKMLWPISKAAFAKRRGKMLREALSVNDGISLNSKTLRNHLEHFDERIDKWYQKSGFVIYADRNVGPRDMNILPGKATEAIFRHYSPADGIYSFHGDEVSIPLMGDELRRIHDSARKFNPTIRLGPEWQITWE